MLHAVLIISGSGLVLFQKEFALFASSSTSSALSTVDDRSYVSLASKSGQLAGIITAVINFSLTKIGGIPAYIEFDHVSVSLAQHATSRVTSAVFHDRSDGEQYGRLMANELLTSFANTYRSQIATPVPRTDLFLSFASKLSAIVTGCIRPVLDTLVACEGVVCGMCAQSDGYYGGGYNDSGASALSLSLSPNTGANAGSHRERLIVSVNPNNSDHYDSNPFDSYTILAQHDALLNLALDTLSLYHDLPLSLTLRNDSYSVLVLRLEAQRCSLIVLYDHRSSGPQHSLIQAHIKQSAHLLQQVLIMANNLKS